MRKYLYSENGFVEKAEWKPNCWVNVECPDDNDFQFLTQELKVPESFLEDIADTDGDRRQLAADHSAHSDAEQPARHPVYHCAHRHHYKQRYHRFRMLSSHRTDTGLHTAYPPQRDCCQQ